MKKLRAPSPNDAPGGPSVPPGRPDAAPGEPGAGKVRLRALRGAKGKRTASELLGRLAGLRSK
jgi:hypothetical protein